MCCRWKHGELRGRHTHQVAIRFSTAEQAKEFYRVCEAQAVSIPDQNQRGCFERGDAFCPIVIFAQQVSHFGNEIRPGFGSG